MPNADVLVARHVDLRPSHEPWTDPVKDLDIGDDPWGFIHAAPNAAPGPDALDETARAAVEAAMPADSTASDALAPDAEPALSKAPKISAAILRRMTDAEAISALRENGVPVREGISTLEGFRMSLRKSNAVQGRLAADVVTFVRPLLLRQYGLTKISGITRISEPSLTSLLEKESLKN